MRKIESKIIDSVGELMRRELKFVRINSNLNLERINGCIIARIYGIRMIEFYGGAINQVYVKIHKNDSLTFKRYANSFLKGINCNLEFFTKNGKLRLRLRGDASASENLEIVLIDFNTNEVLKLGDYIE